MLPYNISVPGLADWWVTTGDRYKAFRMLCEDVDRLGENKLRRYFYLRIIPIHAEINKVHFMGILF